MRVVALAIALLSFTACGNDRQTIAATPTEPTLPPTSPPVVSLIVRGNRVVATTDQNGWYQIDWGCGVGSLGFNTRWNIMSHPDYVSTDFASGRGISGLYREDVTLTRK